MPDNWFRRIAEGVFINGLYDLLKIIFGSAVVALGVALWRVLRHLPVDWWGILALFLFVCVVFMALMRLQRQQPPAPQPIESPAPQPPPLQPVRTSTTSPKPSPTQTKADPMTPLFDTLLTGQMRTLRVNGKKGRFTWLNDVGNIFYEPEEKNDSSVRGVIAEFRNEPGDFSVTTWYGVVASIAYYDEKDLEVADVGRAGWLEEVSSTVALHSHVTRKLLVALRAKDCWVAFDGDETRVLPGNIKRARIILHDTGKFSLPWTMDVDLNLGVAGPLTSLAP